MEPYLIHNTLLHLIHRRHTHMRRIEYNSFKPHLQGNWKSQIFTLHAMNWFWFKSPEPRAAVIADLEHGLFQSKHSDPLTMNIHTEWWVATHWRCAKGAFWPLFLLFMAHDLINHCVLEYSVHKLALVCYLLVNPRLYFSVNRPCSDCLHGLSTSLILIIL